MFKLTQKDLHSKQYFANREALEYFLKSVTNLSRQIVQEGPKTETQLLQMIGRQSDLLHRTRIE